MNYSAQNTIIKTENSKSKESLIEKKALQMEEKKSRVESQERSRDKTHQAI